LEFPELRDINTKRKAHFADIVRLKLLRRYGGVWVDATVLCAESLDRWLPMFNIGSPFFVFSSPGPDRYIASWLIAANKESRIIKKWEDACVRHFSSRWTYQTYYSVHYLFDWLFKTHLSVRGEFRAMAKVSALGPLTLERAAQKSFVNSAEADVIRSSPIHKLSRKSGVCAARYEEVLRQVADGA